MINIDSICAVVVSYNAGQGIIDGIAAIRNQVKKTLIVDNGSNPENLKILESFKAEEDIEIIYNNENVGIAKAFNIGIEYARKNDFKFIITLDQDSICTKDLVFNMIATYEGLNDKDKEKIKVLVPNHIEKEAYYANQVSVNAEYEYVLTEISSGSLIDMSVFDKIGDFDERLFIDLVDHDFCLRVKLNDYAILKVNNAILLHSLGDTKVYKLFGKNITSSNHSALRRYYMTRNRFYIWKKYKQSFPEWVKHDKNLFFQEIARLTLFEKNKLKKLCMIVEGFSDYKKGRFYKKD
ncbi:glycosyltransferase family 2 protein [Clostridium manihotivorum]|uniref:Glycosyltransferase 2-like domain-containing protein n=1 Tax=Clostridium manihotivorum TaxID=2320868 RepID=A0A3R5R1N7_9CLOT|nr:glycosyltransferase family 2 protein [Clostridium manihotivorum]QAA34698.1 hypothetical protein C1I91_25390 [Clostridium manihotivorum]